jgi:capsular polysaccharide biosynthesis protein
MVYVLMLIIVSLCFVVFGLIAIFKISKLDFQRRVMLLEEIILEMKSNLEVQNQKVKLSEDLSLKLKLSNEILSNSIFKLNCEIFKELYARE